MKQNKKIKSAFEVALTTENFSNLHFLIVGVAVLLVSFLSYNTVMMQTAAFLMAFGILRALIAYIGFKIKKNYGKE